MALIAAAVTGCAANQPRPSTDGAAPIPDVALGLSKTSVFDAPAPARVKSNDSGPGELPVLARAYPGAPPRVPHDVEPFLPLTPKSNACVDCHSVAKKEPGQPTPLPASHYTDLRNAPGQRGDQVTGARWVCTSCHAPLTDAKPIVGNAFGAR
jgi:cytochrome c-type protein NapB